MRKLPPKFLAAMIAVRALPGSPMYEGNNEKVVKQALMDLELYKKAEVDSVILENDHDLPYIKDPISKNAFELFVKVAKEVRKSFKGPVGIQVLEGNHMQALEIAKLTDLDFLRVEAYVFAHVGGAGIIEGCAGKLLRRRKELKAEHIKVFADVKKKHCSQGLTTDLSITDEIHQAEFFLVDGIVVTSKFTGTQPKKSDLVKARKATKLPILVGSGMEPENIKNYLPLADGFIVGSTFRKDGKFLEDIDPNRLNRFMKKFKEERCKLKADKNLS